MSTNPPSPDDAKTTEEIRIETRVYSETNSVGSSHGRRRPRIRLEKGEDSIIEIFLVILSYLIVIVCFPFSLLCIFTVIRQFERGVVLRNGKIHKKQPIGPGLVHYLPCIDNIKYTDLRVITYGVPHQEALTKDSLTVSVDAVVYYQVVEPVWAVINVVDYKVSTQFLAAITLRNALGTRKLATLLANRPEVGLQVFNQMKHIAQDWGIKVIRAEIKDIILPLQLQKAMATEAESSRLANSKIIVAKAEIESTQHLQVATATLMDNPMCMQLRYLQSLQTIAGDKTHTIVLPYSMDIFKKIFNK